MALEYRTVQFPNDEEGLRRRNRYNAKMANADWRIVSEGIEQGEFKGKKACCLFFIFPPLAFLAGRAAGVVTITFAREAPRSDGCCSSCGGSLPEGATFCMKCGAKCNSASEAIPQNVKEQKPTTREESGHCATCGSELQLSNVGFFCPACLARYNTRTIPPVSLGSVEATPQQSTTDRPRQLLNDGVAAKVGRVAGKTVHLIRERSIDTIVAVFFVAVLGLIGWRSFISDGPRIPEPLAAGPTTTSSDVESSQPSTHVVLNLPKLVFAPFEEAGRVLGKPSRVTVDHNSETWSEGEVIEAIYRRAECSFLSGRLIAITYTFAKATRPTTVTEELVTCGLPKEAANLSGGHLPYHAMYPANPLRCCGLAFHFVSMPEDFSSIWVVFANMNLHFTEWPSQTQEAWRRAGGPKLSTNPLDWPIVPRKRPH